MIRVEASEPIDRPSGERARIVWSVLSAARRERVREREAQVLLDPSLTLWRQFSGGLHAGDLVALAVENASHLNPLALRPLARAPDAAEGESLLAEADYAHPNGWRIRGKFNVPNERFIVYDELTPKRYAWGGWPVAERARLSSEAFDLRGAEGDGASKVRILEASLYSRQMIPI